MINVDYHLHTDYSEDSKAPMEEMIKAAVEKNIKEIVFTDHVDLIYQMRFSFDDYIRHFNMLKEMYKNKIRIKLGVEIGLGPSTNDENKRLAEKYPFDFIIGSSHDICGIDIFAGNFCAGKDKKTAYALYFEEVLQNIKTCDFFSVYGHLDVIIRYGVYEDNFIEYRDFSDIIDEILKELINRGKGIEINTSGYRYGLNQMHPSSDILKRYHELGGRIITVGSDAHSPQHVANKFSVAEEILKTIGFNEICTYKDREPIYIKL